MHAEYHLVQISDPEGPVAHDLDSSHNGLVSAIDGAIEVSTGIHTGDVHVSVELHAVKPEPAAEWEEIAEISWQSPSGEALVAPLMDDPVDLPSLASRGPGHYRLRVHARGRDTAVDQTVVDEVVESYLLQSWPAAHQEALLVRATDAYGAHLRAQEADDTIVIDHEDSPDTQIGRERDILRRADRGD
ncbi:hypothetical protein GTY82_32185 [Streptomyces sp. SID5476]|uniref:Uncharacterized protein n=1 Tax=Streptomyces bottropensis ATCC 25435 TaxID=1054862 RepID=M3EUD4_9ACTN|nr:hypothetical protein SBD_5804 [Streptomyces bottropensis ATCC 25435]MZD21809.1 hypothetical protein [Streptomyces sp. SID5476]